MLGPPREPAAVGFYLLATFGIAVVGAGEVRSGSVRTGLIGLWASIGVLATWLLWALAVVIGFPDGPALPESVAALLVAGWFGWTATRANRPESAGRS